MKTATFNASHRIQQPFLRGSGAIPFVAFDNARSKALTPTWQDMVHLISQEKLTSGALEAYVYSRINERIAFWNKAYEEWYIRWKEQIDKDQLSLKAHKELCEIPLYVIHNKKVTHEDLIDAVFMFSDVNGKKFYCETQGRPESKWQEMLDHCNGKVAHGRLTALYIQDSIKSAAGSATYKVHFPYYVLATIEHEITHCEQAANGRALVDSTGMSAKTIILMTNKGAHEAVKAFKAKTVKQLRSSNNVSMELEAENRSLEFHPNYCGLAVVSVERKKLGLESSEKEGYFSNALCIARATALLAGRPYDFFEYYACIAYACIAKNNELEIPCVLAQ